MKSRLAGVLLALVLLVAAPVAAEEIEVNGTTQIQAEAGISPDSPFYGLENALKRVRLALTFDDERRAARALDYADERLAEVKQMIEEEKFEAAQRARARYEQELEAAAQAAESIESDSSDERATQALEASSRVRAKLQLRLSHVSDVHEDILERQADRMSDEQLEQLETIFGQIYNRSADTDERIERKREQVKVRTKVLANLTDEQAAELVANISAQTGLDERLERRAEHLLRILEEREERLENDTSNRSAVARERLRMVLDDQLSRIEQRTEIRSDELRNRIESRIRIRADDRDRDDDREIEVELEDGVAYVEVELGDREGEFRVNSTDRVEIVRRIAQRTGLTTAEVRAIIEFESDDDTREREDDDREIEVEFEDGIAYVEYELVGQEGEFRVNSTDRAQIVRQVAARTGLSVSEIRAIIEFESDDDTREREDDMDDAEEIEIEVEIENGIAYVETEVDGQESEFRLETDSRERIVSVVAQRTGLSTAQVRAHIEFEFVDDDSDADGIDDEPEEQDDDDSDEDLELNVSADAQVRT